MWRRRTRADTADREGQPLRRARGNSQCTGGQMARSVRSAGKRVWRPAAALLAGLATALLVAGANARARQPNAEYAERRARLVAQVDGPVVLFGYTGKENTLE